MLDDRGDLSLSRANDTNIPVNIFISKIVDQEDSDFGKFRLTADNFMPRRASVSGEAYEAVADSREEFVDFLKEIRELYATALSKIDAMIDGSETNLYYWSRRF